MEKDVRLSEEGGETLAARDSYTYNVTLRGVGNIFRYDGPHPSHQSFHHVHRYDVLGDGGQEVSRLEEDETPTLGEVIDEAENWYYEHLPELQSD